MRVRTIYTYIVVGASLTAEAVVGLIRDLNVMPADSWNQVESLLASSGVVLGVARKDDGSSEEAESFNVAPLTNAAAQVGTDFSLNGTLRRITQQNVDTVTNSTIALINCNSNEYDKASVNSRLTSSLSQSRTSGLISASSIIIAALERNTLAVILYNLERNFCAIESKKDEVAAKSKYIFSMIRVANSRKLVDMVNTTSSTNTTLSKVDFGLPAILAHRKFQDEGILFKEDSRFQQVPRNGYTNNQSSPTTAVAMIILYSITGIITTLFLIIIVSGAIRAHRHPERYGPRNELGQVRQSRARGLARAMLDTLPIVKYEDRNVESMENISRTNDTELRVDGDESVGKKRDDTGLEVEITQNDEIGRTNKDNCQSDQPTETAQAPQNSLSKSLEYQDNQSLQNEKSLVKDDYTPGCCICTEDFKIGDNVRVLPCNHKFHPPCIDPWLLNVSGTCPLCRIDLTPNQTSRLNNDQQQGNSNLINERRDWFELFSSSSSLSSFNSHEGGINSHSGDVVHSTTPRSLGHFFDNLNARRTAANSADHNSRDERLAVLTYLRTRLHNRSLSRNVSSIQPASASASATPSTSTLILPNPSVPESSSNHSFASRNLSHT